MDQLTLYLIMNILEVLSVDGASNDLFQEWELQK
jgi:hypothetical protein